MPSFEDVTHVVATLAEVTEGVRYQHRSWAVAGAVFAWERPFTKADLKRFGDAEHPTGPILAVACADLAEKESVLGQGTAGVFDIEHFRGYAAYLVALDDIGDEDLLAALQDGWAAKAPDRLLPGRGA